MSSPRPPGWYDEPSGDPSRLRWWDGTSWTSVTRGRSSGEQPVDAIGATGPADVLDSERAAPGPSRRTLVLAGAGVVVVVLLLLVGLPNGGQRADPVADRPGPVPTFSPLPSPVPTTPMPVTGRVNDRTARLAYDVLPGEWREWDRDTFGGLQASIGYYRITQEDAPNQQTYWANVVSGVTSPRVVERTDLPGAATQLVDRLARDYYPEHRRTGETRRALTVDGAPAYLVRYTAVFDPAAATGYAAKSEAVTVLLVDTGEGRPSALYVSLPDTVRDLWPSVEPLLASVRVLR